MLEFLKHLSDKIMGRRELMAFALVGGLLYGFVAGQVEGKDFVSLVTMVLAFYFGQRGAGQSNGSN